MEKIKQNPIIRKIGINRIVLCGVLLLMYVIFCILSDNFVGMQRIMSALNYAYFLGFLSLGVTFVIATGGIDFSIGPVMFCSALISGYCLTHYGVPLAVSRVIRFERLSTIVDRLRAVEKASLEPTRTTICFGRNSPLNWLIRTFYHGFKRDKTLILVTEVVRNCAKKERFIIYANAA